MTTTENSNFQADDNAHPDLVEKEQLSLPRTDGGQDAWLFLCGSFVIEALVWGFPCSFGVFQQYYSMTPPFSAQPSAIAVIGTSASGVMYLGAPFCFFALQAWPRTRRLSSMTGLIIITLALVASSFSNSVWQLILTQGVLYAIGGALLYSPTILYLDEWFVIKKGTAFGIMWAGTGTSGTVVPFIMSWGLERYGFRTMLRAWAITLVLLAAPLVYYVKPRIPISYTKPSSRRPISFQFVQSRKFWIYQAGNILQSLGFFIPGIFLPSYVQRLGLSSFSGSMAIALLNISAVMGQVSFGILIDHMHVTSVILITSLGATVAVLMLWGLATTMPLICVFASAFGLFAGGFTSSWSGTINEVKKEFPFAETGTIFGLLAAGRGIGAVSCGPISSILLKLNLWHSPASLGYGSGYGPLIVFTGLSAFLGSLSFFLRCLRIM